MAIIQINAYKMIADPQTAARLIELLESCMEVKSTEYESGKEICKMSGEKVSYQVTGEHNVRFEWPEKTASALGYTATPFVPGILSATELDAIASKS